MEGKGLMHPQHNAQGCTRCRPGSWRRRGQSPPFDSEGAPTPSRLRLLLLLLLLRLSSGDREGGVCSPQAGDAATPAAQAAATAAWGHRGRGG
jgi:hypothetical protein